VDKFWNDIGNEYMNEETATKSNRKHSKHTDKIERKTAKKVSPAPSTSCDDENEEQDEQIEIDLVGIKKQLEMEPLIEWNVGNVKTLHGNFVSINAVSLTK
ncbi:27263_t:CDS:2, partial [Dentiscutata erythropus]